MRKTAALLSAVLLGGLMGSEASAKNRIVEMETSKGTIVFELYDDQSPKTAANFADLAMGKKEWTDESTGQKKKSHYYDGLIFHRVIPNFMIQGGDPLGNGTGGPGYKFADEYPQAKFDRPGRVAMANAGPNTNGSQFFITVANDEFLNTNGHYVIFGQVTSGQDVADAISKVPTQNDRPVTPVTIKKVTVKAGK